MIVVLSLVGGYAVIEGMDYCNLVDIPLFTLDLDNFRAVVYSRLDVYVKVEEY